MIKDDKRQNNSGHATRHQREMDVNEHLDRGAIDAGGELGTGADVDAAVLAATNLAGNSNGAELVTKLSIGFSCENLPNMDTTSESGPFVVLYKKINREWKQIGNTEIIHDNLNPQFVKKILVDYHFEEQEFFKVEVYDSDDDS